MTDQSADPHYAIMRTERITSWSHAYWVGQHNARDMETLNADPSEAKPIHEFGTGNTKADLIAAHERFKPRMTKDAVLGLEFIFTTSKEAFDGLHARARLVKAFALLQLAREYLEERYPHDGQIVSLVLHLDERVPHIHGCVLPVFLRVDGRSGEREYFNDKTTGKRKWRTKTPTDRKPIWMLSADRDMGGKAQLAIHQSQWAKMVEHLGLVRGRKRSGAVHTTNKEHVAELDRQIASTVIEREGLERDRTIVAEEHDRQQDLGADLDRRAVEIAALESTQNASGADLVERFAALAEAEAKMAEAEAKMAESRSKQKAWVDRQKARAQDLDDWERALNRRNAAIKRAEAAMEDRGSAIAEAADVTLTAMQMIDTDMLPPEMLPRFFKAANAMSATIISTARHEPAFGLMAATLSQSVSAGRG